MPKNVNVSCWADSPAEKDGDSFHVSFLWLAHKEADGLRQASPAEKVKLSFIFIPELCQI